MDASNQWAIISANIQRLLDNFRIISNNNLLALPQNNYQPHEERIPNYHPQGPSWRRNIYAGNNYEIPCTSPDRPYERQMHFFPSSSNPRSDMPINWRNRRRHHLDDVFLPNYEDKPPARSTLRGQPIRNYNHTRPYYSTPKSNANPRTRREYNNKTLTPSNSKCSQKIEVDQTVTNKCAASSDITKVGPQGNCDVSSTTKYKTDIDSKDNKYEKNVPEESSDAASEVVAQELNEERTIDINFKDPPISERNPVMVASTNQTSENAGVPISSSLTPTSVVDMELSSDVDETVCLDERDHEVPDNNDCQLNSITQLKPIKSYNAPCSENKFNGGDKSLNARNCAAISNAGANTSSIGDNHFTSLETLEEQNDSSFQFVGVASGVARGRTVIRTRCAVCSKTEEELRNNFKGRYSSAIASLYCCHVTLERIESVKVITETGTDNLLDSIDTSKSYLPRFPLSQNKPKRRIGKIYDSSEETESVIEKSVDTCSVNAHRNSVKHFLTKLSEDDYLQDLKALENMVNSSPPQVETNSSKYDESPKNIGKTRLKIYNERKMCPKSVSPILASTATTVNGKKTNVLKKPETVERISKLGKRRLYNPECDYIIEPFPLEPKKPKESVVKKNYKPQKEIGETFPSESSKPKEFVEKKNCKPQKEISETFPSESSKPKEFARKKNCKPQKEIGKTFPCKALKQKESVVKKNYKPQREIGKMFPSKPSKLNESVIKKNYKPQKEFAQIFPSNSLKPKESVVKKNCKPQKEILGIFPSESLKPKEPIVKEKCKPQKEIVERKDASTTDVQDKLTILFGEDSDSSPDSPSNKKNFNRVCDSFFLKTELEHQKNKEIVIEQSQVKPVAKRRKSIAFEMETEEPRKIKENVIGQSHVKPMAKRRKSLAFEVETEEAKKIKENPIEQIQVKPVVNRRKSTAVEVETELPKKNKENDIARSQLKLMSKRRKSVSFEESINPRKITKRRNTNHCSALSDNSIAGSEHGKSLRNQSDIESIELISKAVLSDLSTNVSYNEHDCSLQNTSADILKILDESGISVIDSPTCHTSVNKKHTNEKQEHFKHDSILMASLAQQEKMNEKTLPNSAITTEKHENQNKCNNDSTLKISLDLGKLDDYRLAVTSSKTGNMSNDKCAPNVSIEEKINDKALEIFYALPEVLLANNEELTKSLTPPKLQYQKALSVLVEEEQEEIANSLNTAGVIEPFIDLTNENDDSFWNVAVTNVTTTSLDKVVKQEEHDEEMLIQVRITSLGESQQEVKPSIVTVQELFNEVKPEVNEEPVLKFAVSTKIEPLIYEYADPIFDNHDQPDTASMSICKGLDKALTILISTLTPTRAKVSENYTYLTPLSDESMKKAETSSFTPSVSLEHSTKIASSFDQSFKATGIAPPLGTSHAQIYVGALPTNATIIDAYNKFQQNVLKILYGYITYYRVYNESFQNICRKFQRYKHPFNNIDEEGTRIASIVQQKTQYYGLYFLAEVQKLPEDIPNFGWKDCLSFLYRSLELVDLKTSMRDLIAYLVALVDNRGREYEQNSTLAKFRRSINTLHRAASSQNESQTANLLKPQQSAPLMTNQQYLRTKEQIEMYLKIVKRQAILCAQTANAMNNTQRKYAQCNSTETVPSSLQKLQNYTTERMTKMAASNNNRIPPVSQVQNSNNFMPPPNITYAQLPVVQSGNNLVRLQNTNSALKWNQAMPPPPPAQSRSQKTDCRHPACLGNQTLTASPTYITPSAREGNHLSLLPQLLQSPAMNTMSNMSKRINNLKDDCPSQSISTQQSRPMPAMSPIISTTRYSKIGIRSYINGPAVFSSNTTSASITNTINSVSSNSTLTTNTKEIKNSGTDTLTSPKLSTPRNIQRVQQKKPNLQITNEQQNTLLFTTHVANGVHATVSTLGPCVNDSSPSTSFIAATSDSSSPTTIAVTSSSCVNVSSPSTSFIATTSDATSSLKTVAVTSCSSVSVQSMTETVVPSPLRSIRKPTCDTGDDGRSAIREGQSTENVTNSDATSTDNEPSCNEKDKSEEKSLNEGNIGSEAIQSVKDEVTEVTPKDIPIIEIKDEEDEQESPKTVQDSEEIEIIDLTWIDDFKEEKDYKYDFRINAKEEQEEVSSGDSGTESPSAQIEYSSDLVLKNRSCLCGKDAIYVCYCNTVMYCSQQCQYEDWTSHQRVCTGIMQ